MLKIVLLPVGAFAAGADWARIGPWNIFDDQNGKGEAGTLACAASPAKNPDLIYAGGQNNGVSSGIIKSVDGGKHWTRNSKGLWDTRILGVWLHPDAPTGNHVFAGTHSGVYESTDGAASWTLCKETAAWGFVTSFRAGLIGGEPYLLANSEHGILTRRRAAKAISAWQRIESPGGIANNGHLSVVTTGGRTEVLTCIGGWGGGKLYYASLDAPTRATWSGPLKLPDRNYTGWATYPGQSLIFGRCSSPTACGEGVRPIGVFDTLGACQAAVNKTSPPPRGYTYQSKDPTLGGYAGHCYALSAFGPFDLHPQKGVASGRAPGFVAGEEIDCSNAAVDPRDRDHFLFSRGGEFRTYESRDGGRTVSRVASHDVGAFFVLIDSQGWYYTATQDGAFVSRDGGVGWEALHVVMHSRDGRRIDRVPHDYQRIVPDFRGDGIAFPSDQGLHILNRSSDNLTSAVGDMRNTMALSAILSPNEQGSRSLVVNLWDWNVGASWDDGATWAGWAKGEASPGSCGEGGGGQGLGRSRKAIMFHRNHFYNSSDGGRNWARGNLPAPMGAFVYVRQPGSRTEPAGACFALFSAPAGQVLRGRSRSSAGGAGGGGGGASSPDCDYSPELDDEQEEAGEDEEAAGGPQLYSPGLLAPPRAGSVVHLMTSSDFGGSWSWAPLQPSLQPTGLEMDPTGNGLYAFNADCLSVSSDQGRSWSPCSQAAGLTGRLHQLLVVNTRVMFLTRVGAVPLRTTDGGQSWHELGGCAHLFKHGATLDGSLSWSGRTLVLHGADLGAIGRGEYGTAVWRSTNDGDDWTDETGDLVTISPGPGVWYEDDFYLVTRGEGVTVKRQFER